MEGNATRPNAEPDPHNLSWTNGRGYNQFVQSLNYGSLTFDTRHRFVLAPILCSAVQELRQYVLGVQPAGFGMAGLRHCNLCHGPAISSCTRCRNAASPANSMWCSPGTSFYNARRSTADRSYCETEYSDDCGQFKRVSQNKTVFFTTPTLFPGTIGPANADGCSGLL